VEERKWAVEGIRAGAEYAQSVGVNLTIECWNRYETSMINRLEQGVEMLREVNMPNVGVMGDTFHMNIDEANIAEAFRKVGKGYLTFELLPASADPFGTLEKGGGREFFDAYTKQAIDHLKAVEKHLA
jgi:hypothetical protein